MSSQATSDRELWPQLSQVKGWGGHLHRAVLRAAIEDASDEEVVDLAPLYAHELALDPKGRIDEGQSYEDRLERASLFLAHKLRNMRENERLTPGRCILSELDRAFGYGPAHTRIDYQQLSSS